MKLSWVVPSLTAVLVATGVVAGVGPRSKCDNELSKLCDGLVAVYEFEEGLASGSTPTLPDAVRRNSFGLGDLYEPDGIDVGGGSTQAAVNNGKLGFNPTTTTPDQITGLKAWLKADSLALNDGDAVGAWADSTATGFNLSQGTAANKPTFKTGIVNGKPVVRFDGSNDSMISAIHSSNIISTTTGVIFVVYKRTAGTYLFNGGGDWFALRPDINTGTTLRAYNWDSNADNADKTVTNGNWYIGMWRHAGGNLSVSANDTRTASLSSVGSNATQSVSSALTVGSYTNQASGFFNGDIAEIVAFNVDLSEADRVKVEAYLADKYNIGLPYNPGGTAGADPDAAEFDGSTQYLHTGMNGRGSGVLGNSTWTVAFWVYPDTAGSAGQYQYIWSEGGAQNGGTRYGTDLYFYNNAGTFAPRVTAYDAVTNAAVTASWGSNVSTGAWHLVIATYRPRTGLTTGELTIQVDNGTRVVQSMSGFFGIQTGVGSVIGRSASGPLSYFDGRLDQLTISAITWETTDATSFWNGGAGREFPFVGN